MLYVDTHAGRGSHMRGQFGSPLVALTTLLEHSQRASILSKGEVHFHFIEHDAENHSALVRELEDFDIPDQVHVQPTQGDAFVILDEVLQTLDQAGSSLAPSFIFCDPFGFSIPGATLRRLMKFQHVELFINVIWRELDMAIAQGRAGMLPPAQRENLNAVFDGRDWQGRINALSLDERGEQCVDLFRELAGAKWATDIRMEDNGRTRYFLLHLTNHPAGRDLMKECIWKVCPEGGFRVRRSDNPHQRILVTPEPNLRPLTEWICEQLQSRPHRWSQLHALIREELWLPKHVNKVVRDLRRQGLLVGSQFTGQFAAKSNPLLSLTENN